MADVTTTCAAYDVMAGLWPLVRDLYAGQQAMWDAGTRWLPQWPKESPDRYSIRLANSFLFNGYRRTVQTLVGKGLKDGISIGEDMPEVLEEFAENMDLEGRALDQFARDVFEDALVAGLSHILVDYQSETAQNLDEERRLGLRPYCVHVPAEHLTFWRSELIAGQRVLTEARIKEAFYEPDGWGEKLITQYRVLYTDRWEVYRKTEKGDWTLYESGTHTLGQVPLVTVYTGRIGFMAARPPLLDLAMKNLEHYRSASEQRHILSVVRRPAFVMTGVPKEEAKAVELGPHTALRIGGADAKVYFAETSGEAATAGREDLNALKEEMAALGLELLIRKPGSMTATQKALDTAESDSALGAMVVNLRDSLEQVFAIMGAWIGVDETGSVNVNTDIGFELGDASHLAALKDALTLSAISKTRYTTELKRRDVLGDDYDPEEDAEALEAEGGGLSRLAGGVGALRG